MELNETRIGVFRTGIHGIFSDAVFIISGKSGNGRVWHIQGKRYETLDDVRKKFNITEEHLLMLSLEFGVPRKNV